MVTTTLINAVLGHDRSAASARLRTVAPMPWGSGGGVCPSPVRLLAADLLAVRVDVSRIDAAGPAAAAEQLPTYRSIRQFDKHDPGSTLLRPPV